MCKADGVIDNGGPAGVLYELLVACFYYGFIAASIAEVHYLPYRQYILHLSLISF